MPETLEDFLQTRPPTAERPLLGQTVLVVEDSRFACEAMRMLCQRSGARIRRADSLKSAERHLRTYRPSIIVVDVGLPDGSGLDLVHELAAAEPRVDVIIATSGDETLQNAALKAGTDTFLAKPITSLAMFQSTILGFLPDRALPAGLRVVTNEQIRPDTIALRDDLSHIAEIISADTDERTLDYLINFIAGIAKSANDAALSNAAKELAACRSSGRPTVTALARVAGLVQDRLAHKQAV